MSELGIAKRQIGADGLYPIERTILDRWEGGVSIEAIVADGFNPRLTKETVSRFAVTGRNSFEDMTKAGTALLAQAIAQSGGRFA